jgi:hypothetical protein
MQAIEDKFREDGITVPFTFNDPYTNSGFANGPGAVDIYGFDSYPLGFDCSNPDVWPSDVATYYRAYHEGLNPSEPLALYEFQGKQLWLSMLFWSVSLIRVAIRWIF